MQITLFHWLDRNIIIIENDVQGTNEVRTYAENTVSLAGQKYH